MALLSAGVAAEVARWSAEVRAHAVPQHAAALPPGLEPELVETSSSLIDMPDDTPQAHANALAVLPGDEMLAFWFAGSGESKPDVRIFASRWSEGDWQPARPVVDRASLGRALGFGVRRIGNPTAWVARDGTVHLFVVATGLGGWAASRIVHLVSDDVGENFTVRRVLPMSPLFNTSVLVRTTPVGLTDGGWWLPAHFELGHKYPMLMSFDARGEPRSLERIGERSSVLQPALAAVSAGEVRAWMRDRSDVRKVQQAASHDGGRSWTDLPPMELPNHDTSVAAMALRGGGFVLLHNHVVEGGPPRSQLRLSVSKDAKSWTPKFDVAVGQPHEEHSYPSVTQVGDELHVTYTYRRHAIAHHVYQVGYRAVKP